MFFSLTMRNASSASLARTAVTFSTFFFPRRIASENATVRRTAVGASTSSITILKPARYNLKAMPEARSPAPRITTSIFSPHSTYAAIFLYYKSSSYIPATLRLPTIFISNASFSAGSIAHARPQSALISTGVGISRPGISCSLHICSQVSASCVESNATTI